MSSLVSVIIPVYNRAHLIEETLLSVLHQTYENWECIVVDDWSTDNIKELIASDVFRDSRFKFYERPFNKRKGANSCRNYGVEKSIGDFLLFLDSDDILKNNCLRTRLDVFVKFPFLDFAIFSMGLIKDNKMENYKYPDLTNANREELISLFITGPLPWNMTRPLWKISFFLNQIGFNEELDMFDDDEFNLRVIYSSEIRFKFIDNTDCYYRLYDDNLSKYKNSIFLEKLFRSHLLFLKTINQKFDLDDKIKFKKELQQNVYGIMEGYLRLKNVDKRIFKYNIIYFFSNFKASFSFKFFIFFKYILSSYSEEKKGSYKINKFLDSKIKQIINKC
ncbi:glycosyltransferase family 2 protein [Flavobacterium sp. IMCC34518]|uniref:glycosyltransferase family 2 protein n=1 Tax=Flavobacterium sp. IMCC34518 TaxID=3003623 RepID=UPI002482AC75|nr:glycosyltransferase family 2 protein [Flavobacterium sp. IMCC34518]